MGTLSDHRRAFALATGLLFSTAFSTGTAIAQGAPASTTQPPDSSSQNGWKKFNGGWGNQNTASPRASAATAPSPTTAVQVTQDAGQAPPANISPDSSAPPSNVPVIRPDTGRQEPPAEAPLTIQPGTILIVRINQALSSDRNQVGDIFSATLTQPLIVRGIVVAQRGQTVAGRVMEAKKAGKVSGVSHLGIALTSLTLADGQNVPIESQLLVRKGPTSVGRDAAAVAGTTALGAAIGAAADWGRGAAIGAGAGAFAGVLGVLLTRGYPTVVYPETQLTFQVTAPVPINTDYAPQAFRAVGAADYPQSSPAPQQEPPPQASAPPPPAYQYPYAYPYPYPYYAYYGAPYYPYYPYYGYGYGYGYPFFFGFYGRGFYGGGFRGGGFHGGGFHGGGFHGGGGHGGHR
jgi:uncharacterized membrane protein YgcG